MQGKIILLLVLSANVKYALRNMRWGIEKTWTRRLPPGYRKIYYFGDARANHLSGNRLYLTAPDNYKAVCEKTMAALEYVNEHIPYDYVFRTNISSYVDLPELANTIERLDERIVYAGLVGKHRGIEFASGAGILMSRECVRLFLQNKGRINHNFLDDVALGELAGSLRILVKPLTRMDVSSQQEILRLWKGWERHYHYRCKFRFWRFGDVIFMWILHVLIRSRRSKMAQRGVSAGVTVKT